MKQRADVALVDMGLVATRSKARLLIKSGAVITNGKVVKKPGELVSPQSLSLLKTLPFVGRGGEKLDFALELFNISMSNKVVADIGASTGGFTDCCLQRGACKVYAIDVGHNQLADELVNDPRVINLEGVNIREFDELDELVDIVVADLSYISLQLVLDKIFTLLKSTGYCITLFKPQFEVGKDSIGKGGVVKNIQRIKDCLREFYNWTANLQIYVYNFTRSPILGKQGNQEFLFLLGRDMGKKLSYQIFEQAIEELVHD